MITLHFPDGKTLSLPGSNEVTLDSGLRIEFSAGIPAPGRMLKMSRSEKLAALKNWLPDALRVCGDDRQRLMQKARDDGFYSSTTGDMQLLWTAVADFNQKIKEAA